MFDNYLRELYLLQAHSSPPAIIPPSSCFMPATREPLSSRRRVRSAEPYLPPSYRENVCYSPSTWDFHYPVYPGYLMTPPLVLPSLEHQPLDTPPTPNFGDLPLTPNFGDTPPTPNFRDTSTILPTVMTPPVPIATSTPTEITPPPTPDSDDPTAPRFFFPPSFQLPSTAGKTRRRRKRTVFTEEQLNALEDEFDRTHYISLSTRAQLAEILDLTEEQVRVWFQNKRMALKKLRNNQRRSSV